MSKSEFLRNASTLSLQLIGGENYKWIKGKRAGQGSVHGKFIDNAIKGALILEYKVISA